MLFFAQRRTKGAYLQRCPELFRWTKNLLKPGRVVQAENWALILGFFLNQQHCTQREYFIVRAVTFRIHQWERAVWVYLCMRKWMWERTSVSAFLRYPFFFFMWFFSWRLGQGMGCSGKSTDFESQHCHLLCAWLFLCLGFCTHERKTFTCFMQSCTGKMKSFIPSKQ